MLPAEQDVTTDDAYERNNLWQLARAVACGAENVRFMALWDGALGRRAAGACHMVETV